MLLREPRGRSLRLPGIHTYCSRLARAQGMQADDAMIASICRSNRSCLSTLLQNFCAIAGIPRFLDEVASTARIPPQPRPWRLGDEFRLVEHRRRHQPAKVLQRHEAAASWLAPRQRRHLFEKCSPGRGDREGHPLPGLPKSARPCARRCHSASVAVAPEDVVLVSLGSQAAALSEGSMPATNPWSLRDRTLERKPPRERWNGPHRPCRHSPETSFEVLPIARQNWSASHQRMMISTRRFCGSRTPGPVGTRRRVSPNP